VVVAQITTNTLDGPWTRQAKHDAPCGLGCLGGGVSPQRDVVGRRLEDHHLGPDRCPRCAPKPCASCGGSGLVPVLDVDDAPGGGLMTVLDTCLDCAPGPT
jgi:hypothetical protein